ncbi:hypothetical protein POKO110462_00095 [Pontibacter korlensis]|uniref:PepSY domain-containing protein n=1 Tax=Pontibacter korlensis TaxID=400092 RepID=A0A0E3UWI0_9BACT|nr:hypothetical protein [Pontibacter korlensis]AKD02701.1 hypothetical protein PKOR_05635 [Pontibacter korlensis]
MKKISVLAVAFALAGFTAQAQETATQTTQQTTQQGQTQGKQKITPEELPAAVQQAVTGDEYKDLTVGEVHKVQSAKDGAPVTYEVQFLDSEEQATVVRFDETGKKIES